MFNKKPDLLKYGMKYLSLFILTVILFQSEGFANAQETGNLLTLEEAYILALNNHESIMIAEKEIEKSRLLPKKAIAVIMPRMSIEGGYNEANEQVESGPYVATSSNPGLDNFEITLSGNNIISYKNEWKGKFEFLQPFYEPRFFPLKRQADKVIDSSTENYYQTIQDVLFQVDNIYYEVLKTEKLVLNAEEVLALANEELHISKVKFKAGDVTEDIVLGSELYVTGAERKLIEYKNDLSLAKDTLKNLIGIETLDFDVIKPPKLKTRSERYESLVNIAFKNRHDYKIAVLNVELAETEVDLMKTRFHPSIEGTWNYYRSDRKTINRDKESWVAAVTMKIPIFEGGMRFWDLKEKKEGLNQAKLNLDATNKRIEIEVKDAMLSLQNYESVLKNLQKQVELAQKSYDIIFTQFKYGSVTSLYLNQALTALCSAKTELTTKTYDYYIAIINLEKTIGIFAQDLITSTPSQKF